MFKVVFKRKRLPCKKTTREFIRKGKQVKGNNNFLFTKLLNINDTMLWLSN